MKAVFSHIENPFSLYPTNEYIEMSALANHFTQKQGFETIFMGDEKALKNYKNIKYDYTYRLPTRILKDFPKCFWSAGKLLSLSLMNEPCIHIDNDLFLTKPIPEDFLKNDIYCFHDETFVKNDFDKLQKLFTIQPKESLGSKTISYNCGIMGGQDIETIRKSIDIIFDFISDNANYIDMVNIRYSDVHEYDRFFYPSVLIEQIWLFQIYKFFGKEISSLVHVENWGDSFIQTIRKTGYLHLMQQKKFFGEYIKKALLDKKIEH